MVRQISNTMCKFGQALSRDTMLAGAALAAVGTLRIAHHAATSPFGQSICGAGFDIDRLAFAMGQVSHCWGCPVAIFGAALMAFGLVATMADQHSEQSSNQLCKTV